MLEDLLPLSCEETSDFLYTGLLNEKGFVLKFVTVVGVIAHQELSQVNTRVETLSDTGVDLV